MKGPIFVSEPVKEELKTPNMWAIIFLNDDYTPVDFVEQVLMDEFNHPPEQASIIAYTVHNLGRGIAGIYTKDVCLTKVIRIENWATQEGFPLLPIVEEQFK